jgi:hypothetical protein
LKIVGGRRKIDREQGFVNKTKGQNPVVTKKEFGGDHVVLLFSHVRIDDKGETVSPEYVTASKAEAYALNWTERHQKETGPGLER